MIFKIHFIKRIIKNIHADINIDENTDLKVNNLMFNGTLGSCVHLIWRRLQAILDSFQLYSYGTNHILGSNVPNSLPLHSFDVKYQSSQRKCTEILERHYML